MMPRPALLVLAACLAAAPAHAEFPERPIRLVVPFAPGGGGDLQARLIAGGISGFLGQPVVVENRTGAGGNIGTVAVAQAEPDGYTLLATTPAFAINETLHARPNYAVARDFAGVAPWATSPLVFVVTPSLPVASLGDLVRHARANPGRLSYASGGVGPITHIGQELLKYRQGLDMVHVAYRGQAPAITDLIAGQVQMSLDSPFSSIPFIRAGRLRALATTGAARSEALPEVPSVVEAGYPDLVMAVWYGIAAPRRTPPAVVARLNAAVRAAQALPATRAALAQNGAEPFVSDAADHDRFLQAEVERWGEVIRAAAIKVE
jgi:tripartite-type tricarboxylate transporter receptor subunit TctC